MVVGGTTRQSLQAPRPAPLRPGRMGAAPGGRATGGQPGRDDQMLAVTGEARGELRREQVRNGRASLGAAMEVWRVMFDVSE